MDGKGPLILRQLVKATLFFWVPFENFYLHYMILVLYSILVMENMEIRLSVKNWQVIIKELHDKGFVIVREVLNKKECDALIAEYDADNKWS